jgi:hypothetical protein
MLNDPAGTAVAHTAFCDYGRHCRRVVAAK